MITVYTKNNCPHCLEAKARLKQGQWQYTEVNIEIDTEARDWLVSQGARTMPQIYHNGSKFCEGASELVKMSDIEINEKLGNFNLGGISL